MSNRSSFRFLILITSSPKQLQKPGLKDHTRESEHLTWFIGKVISL